MTFTGSQGNRGLIYTISISEGPLNQMDTRGTRHACDLSEGREEEEEGKRMGERRGREGGEEEEEGKRMGERRGREGGEKGERRGRGGGRG